MKVSRLGYRPWKGRQRRGLWALTWPIARAGLTGVIRRKIYWFVLLLGLADFLLLFVVVYVQAQLSGELANTRRPFQRFFEGFLFTGKGNSYNDFLSVQSSLLAIYLGLAGATLVGNDFRQKGVAFYLSRPITKVHYFLGKLVAAVTLASLVTLVPAVCLFLEYGAMSESITYYVESRGILFAILAQGTLLCVTTSTIFLGLCAILQRTIPTIVAGVLLYILLPQLTDVLRSAGGGDVWQWDLLSVVDPLRWVGKCLFGTNPERYMERLPWALAAIGVWNALALFAFWRKIQAVEIVS